MIMPVPSLLLKQLYTFGSLSNTPRGIRFSIKNRLSDARVTGVLEVRLDGRQAPLEAIQLDMGSGVLLKPGEVTANSPVDFPLRKVVDILVGIEPLVVGKHTIEVHFESKPFGRLKLKVEDAITETDEFILRLPRNPEDDYEAGIIQKRQDFVRQFTRASLEHLAHYSFDPHRTKGNIENFTGVAQVPIGFAGPLHINGEQARGDFLIPMATTEGTLVASYNRGMKLLNLCGGVICTVVADAMQRAPVFVFDDARQGREFVRWVNDHFDQIKEQAEATSKVARLLDIDSYLANKFVYLRFNYTTGDAAGQNMVGRATFAACSWILDQVPGVRHFFLESNFATDKKASQINIMRTRGKRVTAEALVKREPLIQHMRVEPESLAYHYGVANIGSILSGANNNGLHSANGITAVFIATGQDVANVAESSAGVLYAELTAEKDLYISITIPSLIVATYGGGTSLATQKECLDILGCYGQGKVNKLAEIIAGVVLAGELSLASAISSSDWVSSHEQYGRNR
jgi:hydroxymethylglutaryl-CoA reductase (NADPH)